MLDENFEDEIFLDVEKETEEIESCIKIQEDKSIAGNNIDEIKELREWALDCDIKQASLDKLLNILRKRLLPQLPKNSKTFLNTNINHNINNIYNEHSEEIGQYVYFGLKEGIQQCINVNLHTDNELKLQFNVDGLPLFKSDKKQFWPILCKIFSKIDIYKPFAVAIFVVILNQ